MYGKLFLCLGICIVFCIISAFLMVVFAKKGEENDSPINIVAIFLSVLTLGVSIMGIMILIIKIFIEFLS